jgi:hypothetical protein
LLAVARRRRLLRQGESADSTRNQGRTVDEPGAARVGDDPGGD